MVCVGYASDLEHFAWYSSCVCSAVDHFVGSRHKDAELGWNSALDDNDIFYCGTRRHLVINMLLHVGGFHLGAPLM